MERTVIQTLTGSIQYDGAGVKLVRVVGHDNTEEFDPFLMMDAFDADDPADYVKGFPWHPHRGIETVTYLIHGQIEHGDSLGNQGVIRDGDCQWMTAGSGIMHQEMPLASPRMLGVQLWLNLPAKDKMAPPQYRDITAAMIPAVREPGATVRIISGSYAGTHGPSQGDYVRMLMLDVELAPGSAWHCPTDEASTAYAYMVSGSANLAGTPIPARTAARFSKGDSLRVSAGEQGARILLFAARPLGEPIAWGGPIVMNTQEELRHAFAELKAGTFIKQ